MKILVAGPAPPLRGGISSFNSALSGALVAKGHRVRVISFSLQYPSLLFPGKTQIESGIYESRLDIRPVINSVNPFSWFRAAGEIRRFGPDVILVHHWMPFMSVSLASVIRLAKKKCSCPVIVLAHNIVPHEKHMGWKWPTRYLLRTCDGLVAMSEQVLKDAGNICKCRFSERVPHPVYDIYGEPVPGEMACRELGLDPRETHLLFFGMVRRYKGLDLLIRAVACKLLEPLSFRVIVAGEFYDDKKYYLSLMNRLGVADRFLIFDRFIPSDRIRYFFSAADLVTQTYRTATQSGVTQIACHFEKPMLVTAVGGLPETVPHLQAGYVAMDTPEDIAGYIHRFLTRDREKDFGPFLRQQKKRFGWENLVEAIESMAAKPVSRRKGAS